MKERRLLLGLLLLITVYFTITAAAEASVTGALIETSAVNDSGSGNMLDITIYDPDIKNPGRIDTITAKVGAGNSANDMTIRLEETGLDTGIFRYTVYMTDRKSNRQLLYMKGMDKINIKYKETVKTINWDYQSTILTLDKEAYAGYNTSAEVSLFNMELNNNPNKIEYINVLVKTSNSKSLGLELRETKAGSGHFNGKLYFGRSTKSEDNIIKMSGEDSITVTYTNKRDKNDIAQCYAEWYPQDGQVTLDKQEYSGNNTPVLITLTDWDIAEDLSKKDEVKVKARARGTKWDRTVTLIETKRDSGIFTGTLYINGGGSKNPSLKLNPGDTFEIVYTDEDTSSGIEEERTASALWKGVSKAELTLDQAVYKGYDTYMTISLKDPDYNKRTTFAESVEVSIKTSGSRTSKKYILRETGSDTGIFAATLKLSGESANYSTIRVADNDEITVIFVDKNVRATAKFNK